jgi:uncharacterized membrane protein (DUF2068 family)
LAQATSLSMQIARGAIPPDRIAAAQRLVFDYRLDAVVAGILAMMVLALIVEAIGVWTSILWSEKKITLNESPYIATRWAESD